LEASDVIVKSAVLSEEVCDFLSTSVDYLPTISGPILWFWSIVFVGRSFSIVFENLFEVLGGGENAAGRTKLPAGRIRGGLTPVRVVESLDVVGLQAFDILCELIGFLFPPE
jgi:hypothetical protein